MEQFATTKLVLPKSNQTPSSQLAVDINERLESSSLPELAKAMGQFVDLDKSDFPSHDPILAIREITGAAIATEDHTLVVLAAEVYSRDTMEDVRAEKSGHSYPEALTQHKRR
ncbi:hypothetical protein V8B55DRAFT_1585888 [Mucor lusitanicus]